LAQDGLEIVPEYKGITSLDCETYKSDRDEVGLSDPVFLLEGPSLKG